MTSRDPSLVICVQFNLDDVDDIAADNDIESDVRRADCLGMGQAHRVHGERPRLRAAPERDRQQPTLRGGEMKTDNRWGTGSLQQLVPDTAKAAYGGAGSTTARRWTWCRIVKGSPTTTTATVTG